MKRSDVVASNVRDLEFSKGRAQVVPEALTNPSQNKGLGCLTADKSAVECLIFLKSNV